MGTAAKIGEAVLCVEAYLFIRNGADQLHLEGLPKAAEQLDRLFLTHYPARDGDVLVDDRLHPLFYPGQVFLRKAGIVIEVVVEARLNGRADRHFCLREELLHRLRHDMGGAVAQDMRAFGGVPVNGVEGAFPQRGGEVDQLTRCLHGNDLFIEGTVPFEEIEKTDASVLYGVFLIPESYDQSSLPCRCPRNQKASNDAPVKQQS